MKRWICILLTSIMVLCLLTSTGCSDKDNNNDTPTSLKFGIGVKYYSDEPTNASGNINGKGQLTTTAAAVLLDSNSRIVKCSIDTAETLAEYTSSGKYILSEASKTKYELGNDYGLKKASGINKEWYEQIDALCELVKGKTLDEIRTLVADSGKGNSDVINAGCTIVVSDFIYALEEAIKSASAADATADSAISLKISTVQSGKDAASGSEGYNELKATITANALDKDGKTVATRSATAEAKYTFNDKGEVKKTTN